MDSTQIFLENISAYAEEYVARRPAVSKMANARVVATVLLAKDANAKAPAILDVPGFAEYLRDNGVTPQILREALTAVRAERKAEAERAEPVGQPAALTKPRKLRRTVTPPQPEVIESKMILSGASRIIRDIPAGDL